MFQMIDFDRSYYTSSHDYDDMYIRIELQWIEKRVSWGGVLFKKTETIWLGNSCGNRRHR